jgi:hypothetical protein
VERSAHAGNKEDAMKKEELRMKKGGIANPFSILHS